VNIPDFQWPENPQSKTLPTNVVLNYRGSPNEFWSIEVAEHGIFYGVTEVSIEQAKAIASALQELEARQAGLSFPGKEGGK
jgi:hypothetical protein